MRIPTSLHSYLCLVQSVFFKANFIDMRWCSIIILIFISLMAKGIVYLFVCSFATCVSFPVKCQPLFPQTYFYFYYFLTKLSIQCGAWIGDPQIKSQSHALLTQPTGRPSSNIFWALHSYFFPFWTSSGYREGCDGEIVKMTLSFGGWVIEQCQ